jgi:hypothetical protein
VLALLGTHSNEAKKVDEVRGHWAPTTRFPSRLSSYSQPVSLTCTRLLMRLLYTDASALRSMGGYRFITQPRTGRRRQW